MPPLVRALVDFGHILGAVLLVGGLLYAGFVAVSSPAEHSQGLLDHQEAERRRARAAVIAAILLLLATGLVKWMPWTGIGWLGGRGYRTGFLHGKLVLALVVFHLALRHRSQKRLDQDGASASSPRLARTAAALGCLIILLAVLHRSGV